MNKETGNRLEIVMTGLNVPFRIRRDLSVVAEIDTCIANQETRKLGRLAAVYQNNLPAKYANNPPRLRRSRRNCRVCASPVPPINLAS